MSLPRYPEYKDSGVPWLGELPAHWGVSPMKRLLDIQNGADYKHIEAEDGYPVLGSGGQFTFATDYIYDGESVLLGRKGTIDRPLHVNGKFWTVDTMYWSRIRPDVCGRFCYYAATTIPFCLYSTNTALPSMTKGALDAHFVAAPPLDEQRLIAAFLDRETAKIDALIAEQEKLLALLAEKRQATISHAVTRGLDPNAPMKDSGIPWLGEVPAHWAIDRVKASIVSSKNGVWGSDPDGSELDVECVRVADFDRRRLRANDEIPTIRAVTESERQGRLLQKGDLLLEKSGGGDSQPVGQVVHYDRDREAVCSNFVARVVLAPEMDSRYWTYAHAAAYGFRVNVRSIKQTSGIQNLDQTAYFDECWVFPVACEQAAIADFLDNATARIDELADKVGLAAVLLKERRSALIAAAVTGHIDVRGFVEAQAA